VTIHGKQVVSLEGEQLALADWLHAQLSGITTLFGWQTAKRISRGMIAEMTKRGWRLVK